MAARQRVLVAIIASGLLGGAGISGSGARPPRTVVDYYYMLPQQQYFVVDRGLLLRPPGIVDIKNGYLRVGGDGGQIDLAVCLFKPRDGSFLVGVSSNKASDGMWEPFLHFYRYRNGRLVDVTETTLPRHFGKNLGYLLPRYGKTIRVITASGKAVCRLRWDGRKFRVKRAR